jgi:hypothetical protein
MDALLCCITSDSHLHFTYMPMSSQSTPTGRNYVSLDCLVSMVRDFSMFYCIPDQGMLKLTGACACHAPILSSDNLTFSPILVNFWKA